MYMMSSMTAEQMIPPAAPGGEAGGISWDARGSTWLVSCRRLRTRPENHDRSTLGDSCLLQTYVAQRGRLIFKCENRF